MGSVPWSRFQGQPHYALDPFVANPARRARSRLIEQTIQTRAKETAAPLAYGLRAGAQLTRDCTIGLATGTAQHQLRPHRQRLPAARAPCPARQRNSLFRT
jgi:hypothetical protein